MNNKITRYFSSIKTKPLNIIDKTIKNINKGLTGLSGIAASKRPEIVYSASHVLQAIFAGKALYAFKKEFSQFIEKAKISKDYFDTEQFNICFLEYLKFLDLDVPDGKRLEYIQKIILVAASETISTRDDVLPQVYIKTIKKLDSTDILILSTAYTLYKNKEIAKSIELWNELIADKSCLKFSDIVLQHEQNLVHFKLLHDFGFIHKDTNRLTNFAIEMFKFIENYETVSK